MPKKKPKRKKPAKPKLTPDEARFVEEYLIDRNGTRAYLRVNPDVKVSTAAELASRLLKKVKVAAEVRAASRELRKACKTSAVAEVRKLALLANYDIGAAFDLTADGWVILPPRRIPYETRQAIVGVKFKKRYERDAKGEPVLVEDVEYKFADKLAARDKLMRHLGLYKDLPPLEELLRALDPDLAATVRAALAAKLLAGGSPPGAVSPGNATEPRHDPPGGPAPTVGPGLGLPQGGAGAGPVAAGVPDQPGRPADSPVLPAVREDDGGGGADPGPLFDDAEGPGDGVQPD